MANTDNKESAKLRISKVTITGGNTDGKTLFMEIDVFDGEHTNRLEVDFPFNTSAEEITKYCYRLIEENPKMPPEIVGLMTQTIYWDADEAGYYSRVGNGKPQRHQELKSKAPAAASQTAHKK